MEWLSTDDSVPEAGPPQLRVKPFGTPSAKITIITDMPEQGDAESGALLSGEVGRLFDRMLAAIGLTRDAVYCFRWFQVVRRRDGRRSSLMQGWGRSRNITLVS